MVKGKKIIIIAAATLIAAGVFYLLFILLTGRVFPWECAGYENEALSYVEEKYGMRATVEGISSSMSLNTVYITVRPEAEDFTFDVCTPRNKKEYRDTYISDFTAYRLESIVESDIKGITDTPFRISVHTQSGDMYDFPLDTKEAVSSAIAHISSDKIRDLLCDKDKSKYCVVFAQIDTINSEDDVDYEALYPIFDYARNNYGMSLTTFLFTTKSGDRERIYIESDDFDGITCADDMRSYYIKAFY